MLTRRSFLRTSAIALGLTGAPHWLLRMSAQGKSGRKVLVAIFQRGAADGLNVVVPFFADQPFWSDRVYGLGAGPQPIPQGELTAEKLAEAIRVATSDGHIRESAAAVGQAIQAEHGVKEAVAIVNRYLAQRPRFFDGLI